MLQIILCLMFQVSQPDSLRIPKPESISVPFAVTEMNYKGNTIVYAKKANTMTLFSNQLLFYAIDNPEFAEFLINSGIKIFVMADGSTIEIEKLRRNEIPWKQYVTIAVCFLLGFLFYMVIANDRDIRKLREGLGSVIENRTAKV